MRQSIVATVTVGGLLIAVLGVLGLPAAPSRASCAYVGPIPTIRDGQVLFIATVTEAFESGGIVHVERWLVGPAQAGDIFIRGRQSNSPNVWSSVDWAPVVGQAEVIAARPDEFGVLRTSLCSTTPLTAEAVAAIEATYGPAPSPMAPASPVASPSPDVSEPAPSTTPA